MQHAFVKQVACPICKNTDNRVDFSVSASEAAQHFVLRESNQQRHSELEAQIGALWKRRECRLLCCKSCSFRFADPHVSGDELFYNLAYERSGYPGEKWEFDRTRGDLESLAFRGDRALEIGAGFGHFLDRIADIYVPRSGITALEYSDAAVAALRAKGYHTQQRDLVDSDLKGTFDAIFLFQVVEHLDNLDPLFAKLFSLLSDKGLLFIAVPNPGRILFNEKNNGLLDMPPNHINLWNPEAFRRIAERHNLCVDAIETEPFSIVNFIKQDVRYSYLRTSQTTGTLANRSRAYRSATLGKWLGAVAAAAYAPRRARVWVEAARRRDLGDSLWVKCTKGAVGRPH